MDFFFNPDGIAIIGASDNPLRGGYHILNNTLGGYRGRVYPVNPKYDSILGHTCYPDIQSIPDTFDLAIFYIPAKFLPSAIEECAGKKVKGIIIVIAVAFDAHSRLKDSGYHKSFSIKNMVPFKKKKEVTA